jgi:hypothetical protein
VTRTLIVLAWIAAIAGCGDRGAVRAEVDQSANRSLPDTPLEIGVADDVGAWIDHTLVGRMPREVGATMPVPFDGRDCELAVVGTSTVHVDDPRNDRAKRSSDLRYREYKAAELELRCKDGPAPGAAGTQRGGNPRHALVWILPGIVLGFLAGLSIGAPRSADQETALTALGGLALVAVAVAAPVVVALVMFAGWFKLSIGGLMVALMGAAMLAGAQWRVHRIASVAGVVASVAGAVGFGARLTAWSYAAPVAALGVAVGAWVVTMIVIVSIWPAEEMEKRAREKRLAAIRRGVK